MTRTGKVTEDLSYYLKQPQSGKIWFSMEKHKVHPTLWIQATKDFKFTLNKDLISELSAATNRTNVMPWIIKEHQRSRDEIEPLHGLQTGSVVKHCT